MVFALSITGTNRIWVAQKYYFLRYDSAIIGSRMFQKSLRLSLRSYALEVFRCISFSDLSSFTCFDVRFSGFFSQIYRVRFRFVL